jgi:hypothetical protein
MRHVAYDAEDETLSDFLARLSSDMSHVGLLTVPFAELHDAGCRRVLETVERGIGWTRRDASLRAWACASDVHGLRALDLSSNQLTSFVHSGLCAAMDRNGTLTTLELQGNELVVRSLRAAD